MFQVGGWGIVQPLGLADHMRGGMRRHLVVVRGYFVHLGGAETLKYHGGASLHIEGAVQNIKIASV